MHRNLSLALAIIFILDLDFPTEIHKPRPVLQLSNFKLTFGDTMATPPTESDAMTSSFRNPLFDPSNAEVEYEVLLQLSLCKLTISSIVFVHGIGGDSVSTWRSQKGVYWPEELLPSKIRNARILSWPHAAKIGQFFSRRGADYTIDDISKNLLRDVFAYRRDTKTVKVVCQQDKSSVADSFLE